MIAVVGGTLIDGTGRYQAEPVNVVIDGDRVAGVAPAAAMPVPPGATVIDARGRFLTPGLVDMHVHVYTPDKWHPELFLAAGVMRELDTVTATPSGTPQGGLCAAAHKPPYEQRWVMRSVCSWAL